MEDCGGGVVVRVWVCWTGVDGYRGDGSLLVEQVAGSDGAAGRRAGRRPHGVEGGGQPVPAAGRPAGGERRRAGGGAGRGGPVRADDRHHGARQVRGCGM